MGKIIKSINLGEKELIVQYDSKTGDLRFAEEIDPLESEKGKIYTEKTGYGAFATMQALAETLKDINPKKIKYRAVGNTRKEAEIKDKLYMREINKRNYELKESKGEFEQNYDLSIIGDSGWNGPERVWVRKKSDKIRNNSSLEKTVITTSIIGFLGIIFFSYTNLTGNAIGSLNQTSLNWIGIILFIIGLVGAFVYFRKRNK